MAGRDAEERIIGSRRNRKVSIAKMQKQCRTILARDIERLMDVSYVRPLFKDETQSLRGYSELLNEMAELEKIATLEKREKKEE